MPTYSDEVNVYNPNAIKDGMVDARDYYVTSVTNDGIWVTPHDAKPVNGAAASTTRGWHIADALEYFRGTVRYIKAWLNGTVPTVRLGQDSSGHADVTPSGLEVFTNASTSVASFGGTSRIGKAYVNGATDNESHMELDYHSLQLIDKEGGAYFYVSDLRDADGYITDTWDGDGNTTVFDLRVIAANTSYIVKVDGVEVTNGISKSTESITFTTAPTNGKTITAYYVPLGASSTKAYTFSSRRSGKLGLMSVAEGLDTSASGDFSHVEGRTCEAIGYCSHAEGEATKATGRTTHAEGKSTEASGQFSHVEGWNCAAIGACSHAEGFETTAYGNYSHAQNRGTFALGPWETTIGKYNFKDPFNDYALIIGNGTADDARSNALTVTWDGNIISQAMAGIIQMFAGSTAPSGWLVCDGSAVSRTTYATLFAAIGTTWGTGDGSTTFNLPDLRGRAPIGAGTGSGLTARTLGSTGGSEALQSHDHNAASNGYNVPGKNGGWNWRTTSSGSNSNYNNTPMGGSTAAVASITKTGSAGSGNAGNMQPFAVINFIICTGKTS